MNFKNPMEDAKPKDDRGVFFENKDMDTLAAKFLDMQRLVKFRSFSPNRSIKCTYS